MTDQTTPTTTTTIEIRRRKFTVTTRTNNKGELIYVLKGERGAEYATMRNFNTRNMFLIDCRGFGLAKGYEGVWLTDRNGALEVL